MANKHVTVYMSEEGKGLLDKLSREITSTDVGRGVALDVILNFANAHIVNLKAWYEGMRDKKENLGELLWKRNRRAD
jgi:hypothetical protein